MAGRRSSGVVLGPLRGLGDEAEWGSEPDVALLRVRPSAWELALLALVGVAGAGATVLGVVGVALLQ